MVAASVAVVVLMGHGGAPVDIAHRVSKVVAIDFRHVGVWTLWTNEGKSPATESCEMDVTAYSAKHQDIGRGRDVTGPNGDLKPGRTQRLFQVVVMTGNGAGVTGPSDVEIVNC